jgi:competence protein ComEC
MTRPLERLGRRPAAVAAIALAAGLAAERLGLGPASAMLLQAAGLALLLARPRSGRAAIVAAALLVGAGSSLLYGMLRLRAVPAGHVLAALRQGGELDASVEGLVAAVLLREHAGPRVELLLAAVDGRPARGRVLLYLRQPAPGLLAGDRLRARASLRTIPPPLLPGGWDREASMAARDVHAEGTVLDEAAVRRAAPWRRWVPELSERLALVLAGARPPAWARGRFDEQHGPFLAALLLGRRDGLEPELAEAFRRTGLYHLLAISGMHLGLIAAVTYGALRSLLGRRAGAAASIGVLALYTALTSGAASVLRAALMAGLYLLGIVLGRRPDGLSAVCLAAAALLLWRPGLAGDLGFQLTVLATASVLIYTRPLERRIRLPRALAAPLAVSFAAQAATLPLLLAHFRQLSLLGPVTGLLAVLPFTGALALAMAAAALAACGAEPEGPAVRLTLAAAATCASALFELVGFFATLPGASVPTPRLGPWALGLYLALWASFLLRPTAWRTSGQAGLVALLTAALLLGLRPEARAPLRITFLGVGNADCALLELPDGRTALVDGAGDPRGRIDVGSLAVVPFLWHAGVGHVDEALLSHVHPDHALGLVSVLEALPVGRLRTGLPLAADGVGGRLLEAARRAGAPVEAINPYTDTRYSLDENDRSLVLRLAFGRFSALFPGDAERAAEHELADTYGGRLRSAVLKVPHHGSCTSSSAAFLAAVRPRLAIVPVGAQNPFGHPCPEAMERLRRTVGPERVLLSSDGSVRVSTDGAAMQVERYAGGIWRTLWTEPLPEP